MEITLGLKFNIVFDQNGLRSRLASRSPLVVKYGLNSEFVSALYIDHEWFYSFMDVSWQYNNPSNPADAAKLTKVDG